MGVQVSTWVSTYPRVSPYPQTYPPIVGVHVSTYPQTYPPVVGVHVSAVVGVHLSAPSWVSTYPRIRVLVSARIRCRPVESREQSWVSRIGWLSACASGVRVCVRERRPHGHPVRLAWLELFRRARGVTRIRHAAVQKRRFAPACAVFENTLLSGDMARHLLFPRPRPGTAACQNLGWCEKRNEKERVVDARSWRRAGHRYGKDRRAGSGSPSQLEPPRRLLHAPRTGARDDAARTAGPSGALIPTEVWGPSTQAPNA